jgi:hypothetical protein
MKVANRELATRPKGTPWAGRGLVSDVAGFSFVDSSFFLFSLVLMNELAKAVIVLALATAAAVWLMSMALHLWPNTDQLAYGNPLPYLKVSFNRPVNAVKFWVEDFGGLPYERVWLYVNGRLAASGGPGTDATAKCGDEVSAVVKYHSGVKKLEGRILCTKPIKAPSGGEVKREIRLIQTTQAYRAMTGDMDETGPPLRFDGSCDIDVYRNGRASVTIATLRPDVIFCVGTNCGTSYTFSWTLPPPDIAMVPGTVRQVVPIDVFKAPDTPASQLLGGGRGVVDIYVYYDYVSYYNRYDLYVYVNGTRIAECHRETSVSRELTFWTEYKEPNATAVYLTRFIRELPNGNKVVVDGNLVLYELKDGSFGYRFIINPVTDPTPAELNIVSPHLNLTIQTPSGALYHGAISLPFLIEEFRVELHNDVFNVYIGPFYRFLNQLIYDSQQMFMLGEAFDKMADMEFNVPYIAVNGTGEYLVYHTYVGKQSRSVALGFKALSISSLGAVYANAILPIDIKLPPPVPPQNATRTYIVSYS